MEFQRALVYWPNRELALTNLKAKMVDRNVFYKGFTVL